MSRDRKARSAGERTGRSAGQGPQRVHVIERLPADEPLLYGPDGTPLVYVTPPVGFTRPSGASRDDDGGAS